MVTDQAAVRGEVGPPGLDGVTRPAYGPASGEGDGGEHGHTLTRAGGAGRRPAGARRGPGGAGATIRAGQVLTSRRGGVSRWIPTSPPPSTRTCAPGGTAWCARPTC